MSLKDRADYSEVGGAPLLGINGVVIICHGNSKPHTIRNAIRHARQCAELHLNDVISREVSENLKSAMKGLDISEIHEDQMMRRENITNDKLGE